MNKLIIAEKPSVANVISTALKANDKKDGFFIGNDYIVSWCVGHLVQLANAESYNEKYSKWNYTDLPIIPKNWKYTVSSDKTKQMKILYELMKRVDIDSVINACDAGREGELIFRLVYDYCKCKKPIERLWISSMEENTIIKGFQNLRSGDDYDKLYQSALCRTQADWIVGINATRLFSILYGETLNVGRVQSPTLALIVQREQEIAKFIKEPFYTAEINCGKFKATSEKVKDKLTASEIVDNCNGKSAIVHSIEKQQKSIACPKLFDLTTLQRESNRLFGYTAQQTLDYAQSLYEKQLITYPRTDSRYLTEDMTNSLQALIEATTLATTFFNSIKLIVHVKQVIDSSKVTDHHAIIPTITMTKSNLTALPDGERNILNMIITRLICATNEKNVYDETTIKLDVDGNVFTAKGKVMIDEGWKFFDDLFRKQYKQKNDDTASEKLDLSKLPQLEQGNVFNNIVAILKEGFTQPPKSYTEDTLLKAMETAGIEDLTEEVERKGLGTSATRAGIIEKLVKTQLIERKGRNLLPTQKGINLITVLPDMIKSQSLTAEWENNLKQVEKGKITQKSFMNGINSFIGDIIKENIAPKEEYKSLFATKSGNSGESIGTCPRCKNQVIESKKGFFCDNKACDFALWKENKFFIRKKATITKSVATELLKNGRVFMPNLYSEKTGKTYCATIVLDDTGDKYVSFKMEFSNTH